MKTSKIIGIVICILIPLIITSFIAYYSYNDPDQIMGNKNKWEDYYIENYYGTTMEEKLKSVIMVKSTMYDTEPVLTYSDPNERFKLIGFRHVLDGNNFVTYTFYLYGVDFNELDITQNNELVITYKFENVDLRDVEEPDHVYPEQLFDFADTDAKAKIIDTDTEDTTTDTEEKKMYPYSFSLDTNGISDELTLTLKIEFVKSEENKTTLYDEKENDAFTGKGAKITNIIRSANAFKTKMEEGSTIANGLNNEVEKIGKGYTAFIFPTVLWISAVALAISGIMSYLFYIIWTTEEEDSKKGLPRKAKR